MTTAVQSARAQLTSRIKGHLHFIYPEMTPAQLKRLLQDVVDTMRFGEYIAHPQPHHNPWTQQDAIVITYGDTILHDGEPPLRTLRNFARQALSGYVSGIHILPFFPWSSDDGFAVIDYLAVNEALGSWDEISAVAGDFLLMADLVINHCSSRSRWFENFKNRLDPGAGYFVEMDPQTDLSDVVRPRTSPLLRETETLDGKRHVWCTFSHDQVDLNFRSPAVLLEFIRIVRFYLDRGVRIFRLDAVAFLWKEVGTHCINLPQTHEVIRLFRTLIEHCDPEAIIITETNIPNRENLSYFGNANEAHVIYNFSLPPLLLYSLVSGDCDAMRNWLMTMPPAQNGTTYLNFIASHDGIGLRPAEGLLRDDEIDHMAELMTRFGGRISWRTMKDGGHRPYEMNIALYDACKGTLEHGEDSWQTERFICAHIIMLALEGIPAFYIHSFFGTRNDYQRMEHSSQSRAINRHQWQLDELLEKLENPNAHNHQVFERMKQLLTIRRHQPAFHPNATQFTLQLGSSVFGFWRQSLDRAQSIFCLHNVTAQTQEIPLCEINLIAVDEWWDLLTDALFDDLQGTLVLPPYQCVWLTNRRHAGC